MKQKKGVFIVWKKYQRRVEVLAPLLDLDVRYFHYRWEERAKILKLLSYCLKSLRTMKCLLQESPSTVLVQFPPTPALYCVALYAWLTGSKFLSDCHMTEANTYWLNWVFARELLLRGSIIVHNEHIRDRMLCDSVMKPLVVRDGIADKESIASTSLLRDLKLAPKGYVIVPSSFSPDEPIEEIVDAARLLPNISFIMTWYSEKLSNTIRNSLPSNVVLTGYLPAGDFDQIYANAGVALVLTKEENVQLSGMQEAMAFEIPAVVTDLRTTRFLYKKYPIYVENNSQSIACGIKLAFENRQQLVKQMGLLKLETQEEFRGQVELLKAILEP